MPFHTHARDPTKGRPVPLERTGHRVSAFRGGRGPPAQPLGTAPQSLQESIIYISMPGHSTPSFTPKKVQSTEMFLAEEATIFKKRKKEKTLETKMSLWESG